MRLAFYREMDNGHDRSHTCAHTYRQTDTQAHIFTHTCTRRHTDTHTVFMHTCTHAHIHTHTTHERAHTHTHLIIEFDEQWNLLCLDKGYNGFSVKLSIICGSPVIKLSQTRCAYSTSAVTDELEHTHCISSR